MTARVRIEAGQLTPLDEEGTAALSGRCGEYLLAPTSPDLLVLFRAQPSGAQAPSPRVVLAGDASGFPLADLVAFLGQSRFTGTLRVHASSGQRSILLHEGEVHGATSDNPADRLGEIMVRLGYASSEQVEQAMREHPPSRVGRALVEEGFIQPHDVWKCITQQVSEIFQALILCREGAFFVLDQVPEERTQLKVRLSMHSLLMDAIRKDDELAHFRKRIPHGRLFVLPRRPADARLEAAEAEVLRLCDGTMTVLELGSKARLAEFDVTKAVYRLLEGGYVQLADRSSAGAAAPDAPLGRANAPDAPRTAGAEVTLVIDTYNRIFEEIRKEAALHGMDRELVAAANAALDGRALSASPALEDVRFDGQGQLPPAQLRERFEKTRGQMGSDPVSALRQALSDVMFFLLFQAGELFEQHQDEALGRRVKALLAPLDEA
jgi:hypothetical protein